MWTSQLRSSAEKFTSKTLLRCSFSTNRSYGPLTVKIVVRRRRRLPPSPRRRLATLRRLVSSKHGRSRTGCGLWSVLQSGANREDRMAPYPHGSVDTPGGSPWHTLRRDESGAVFHRLVITLDGLLVSMLVVIAFAVHW